MRLELTATLMREQSLQWPGMSTRVRSFSKINLGLAIGPLRADGFHGLTTLYQTIALHDVVTVTASHAAATRLTLTSSHPAVPTDARNTAWRMVERALDRLHRTAEVEIHIQKNLPIQGGMGAGSANAAAALIALERELELESGELFEPAPVLQEADRLAMTAMIGSDVPLFLVGGAVLGTGRGETVRAMSPDLPATPCVVALPRLGVSTPRAFRAWDALYAGEEGSVGGDLHLPANSAKLEKLSHAYASVFKDASEETAKPDASGIDRDTGPAPATSIDSLDSTDLPTQDGPEKKQGDSPFPLRDETAPVIDLAENALLALVRTGIENDFEQVVFLQYPSLREIKRQLMGCDSEPEARAFYAALSGSGSALFGLYGSTADARAAQLRVQALGVQALITETLPRSVYWRRMFAE